MPLEPYTIFGKTRSVPLVIWRGGQLVDGTDYEATLWVESSVDYYALMSIQLRGKRVRIVTRDDWLCAELVEEFGSLGYSWEDR